MVAMVIYSIVKLIGSWSEIKEELKKLLVWDVKKKEEIHILRMLFEILLRLFGLILVLMPVYIIIVGGWLIVKFIIANF